jgi:hypothetical protein
MSSAGRTCVSLLGIALAGGCDQNAQILFYALLPDQIHQRARAQCLVQTVIRLRLSRDNSLRVFLFHVRDYIVLY